jgi:hypothetical protein
MADAVIEAKKRLRGTQDDIGNRGVLRSDAKTTA